MLKELFSNRLFIGALAFFILCVVGGTLYISHVEKQGVEELATDEDPVKQVTEKQQPQPTAEAPVGEETPQGHFHEDGTWHGEPHETPSTSETAAETIDSTETMETDAVSADALDASKMSRFGLGSYPEIPKEWNFIPNYWETVEDIETELLRRVTIKMHNEGIRSKYGSVGIGYSTGLITALERGSVLVEYDIDENGEKRIWRTLAHPDDLSQGTYTRFSEIPSHLKIVTPDEIAFDPYEYLGLSK